VPVFTRFRRPPATVDDTPSASVPPASEEAAEATVEAAPDEAVPGDLAPADVVPGEAVPVDPAPAAAVPGEALPGEGVPDDAVRAEAVPDDAPPAEAPPDEDPSAEAGAGHPGSDGAAPATEDGGPGTDRRTLGSRLAHWHAWRDRHPTAALVLHWSTTVLAAVLVFVGLVMPNRVAALQPNRFTRLPAEAIVAAAGRASPPRPDRKSVV